MRKKAYQDPEMDIVVLFGDVKTTADNDGAFIAGDVIGTSNPTIPNTSPDWTIWG